MNLQIYYPFKQFWITQPWGVSNPAYATQFGDPNFKRHNGIDAAVIPAKKTYPVFCPVEGFKVQQVRYNPEGGGHEVWLISKNKLQMFEKECYAYLCMVHAEKILVPVGYEPALGELIMIADNTGFSTGPHTHIGLYRVNYDGKRITYLDKNDATGSYDPYLFFTKQYAVDVSTLATNLKSGMRYFAYLLGK